MKRIFIAFCITLSGICLFAQDSKWVSPVANKHMDYGVFMFRNSFILDDIPEGQVNIRVSADNRYKLFVNGSLMGLGPARGDLGNWYYETYDIVPALRKGKNVIAVEVINFGRERPMAQVTKQTALWVMPENESFKILGTGNGNWLVSENRSCKPVEFGIFIGGGYYVCGPGDSINYKEYPFGWKDISYNDTDWQKPVPVPGSEESSWNLVPRNIPFMDYIPESAGNPVRMSGAIVHAEKHYPIIVEPNRKASVLFDRKMLTVGYPELDFSRGKGSKIKITYAESLFDSSLSKGNRDEIVGKEIIGYYDVIYPSGQKNTVFTPLWLRTFRYAQIDIETGPDTLVIQDFKNNYSLYPLKYEASFQNGDPLYDKMQEISWRTLKLCAGETYFDCPYYEQLNYANDTRVQMLITYTTSTDDRLAKKTISEIGQTQMENGLTHSRHPSNAVQIIPPNSLYWVSMLHDYLHYKQDTAFLRDFIPKIDPLLEYFRPYIRENGMLGFLPHGDTVGGGLPEYWYFTDWSKSYKRGIPFGVYDGHSSVISLQYAITLKQAAVLMEYFGNKEIALNYSIRAEALVNATIKNCFDPVKGLLAETPEKKIFSQHANLLAVLCGGFTYNEAQEILLKLISDNTLVQCSMYHRFYLIQALSLYGLKDKIISLLDFWTEAMDMALSTFPEKERSPRSDCHGWNASPLFIMYSNLAGIEPASPLFRKVRIDPFLTTKQQKVTFLHPQGTIKLELKEDKKYLTGTIILPEGVDGILTYKGNILNLNRSVNKINSLIKH
jgi:alpha-L-rhamnosidase